MGHAATGEDHFSRTISLPSNVESGQPETAVAAVQRDFLAGLSTPSGFALSVSTYTFLCC